MPPGHRKKRSVNHVERIIKDCKRRGIDFCESLLQNCEKYELLADGTITGGKLQVSGQEALLALHFKPIPNSRTCEKERAAQRKVFLSVVAELGTFQYYILHAAMRHADHLSAEVVEFIVHAHLRRTTIAKATALNEACAEGVDQDDESKDEPVPGIQVDDQETDAVHVQDPSEPPHDVDDKESDPPGLDKQVGESSGIVKHVRFNLDSGAIVKSGAGWQAGRVQPAGGGAREVPRRPRGLRHQPHDRAARPAGRARGGGHGLQAESRERAAQAPHAEVGEAVLSQARGQQAAHHGVTGKDPRPKSNETKKASRSQSNASSPESKASRPQSKGTMRKDKNKPVIKIMTEADVATTPTMAGATTTEADGATDTPTMAETAGARQSGESASAVTCLPDLTSNRCSTAQSNGGETDTGSNSSLELSGEEAENSDSESSNNKSATVESDAGLFEDTTQSDSQEESDAPSFDSSGPPETDEAGSGVAHFTQNQMPSVTSGDPPVLSQRTNRLSSLSGASTRSSVASVLSEEEQRVLQATSFLEDGSLYKAFTTFSEVLSLSPGCFDALHGQAQTLFRMRRFVEAAEHAVKAARLVPWREDVPKLAAKCYIYEGRLDDAKQFITGCLPQCPGLKQEVQRMNQLCDKFLRLKRCMKLRLWPIVREIVDELLKIYPNCGVFNHIKAKYYIAVGEFKQAHNTAQNMALTSETPHLTNEIFALVYYKVGHIKEALEHCEVVVSTKPDYEPTNKLLVELRSINDFLHLHINNEEVATQALAKFDEISEGGYNNSVIQCKLICKRSRAYIILKDYYQALCDCLEVTRIDPNDKEVKELHSEITQLCSSPIQETSAFKILNVDENTTCNQMIRNCRKLLFLYEVDKHQQATPEQIQVLNSNREIVYDARYEVEHLLKPDEKNKK